MEAAVNLMLGVCAMSKCDLTSAHISSRVPSVDIRAQVHKRWSLNVTWRCACTCVISPNPFETTSRGGFGGTSSIWINSAVRTRFNRLGQDPWCSADRAFNLDSNPD